MLRRTTFGVGIAASLVASLPVLTFPGLGGLSLLWAVWSAFCFGLIVYLVMGLAAVDGLRHNIAGRSSWLWASCSSSSRSPGARAGSGNLRPRLEHLRPGSSLGVHVEMARKRGAGATDLRQAFSLAPDGLAGVPRRGILGERQTRVPVEGTWSVRRWLLRRCFARISRRPALSLRRHLAAAQYELAGYLVPLRPWTVPIIALSVLVLLVVAGYLPS